MIDFYVIFYLLRRFNLTNKIWNNQEEYLRFKKYSYWFFWIFMWLRIYFDHFPSNIYFRTLFSLANYWGYFSFFVLVFFYYSSLILFPFIIAVLALTGYIGYSFFPTTDFTEAIQEQLKQCHHYHRDGKYTYTNCSNSYLSILSRFRQFETFYSAMNNYFNEIDYNKKNNHIPACDPVRDRLFLNDTHQYDRYLVNGDFSCSNYQSFDMAELRLLHNMYNGWSFFDPEDEYFSNINSGLKDSWNAFNTVDKCIESCKKFPEIVKKSTKEVRDAYWYEIVGGKLRYPLKCEYRCKTRKSYIDLVVKKQLPLCRLNIDFKKNEEMFQLQGRTCSFFQSFLKSVQSYYGNVLTKSDEQVLKKVGVKYKQFKEYKKTEEYKRKQKFFANPVR